MTTYTTPLVQPRAAATTHHILGGAVTVRLRAEDTDGAMGLIDYTVPGGFPGPAMHVHPEFDEIYLVLEGSLALRIGDHAHEAGPGTVAFVPRGTPHTFANPSASPTRALVVVTPGGFERYFAELARIVEETGTLPPEAELVDLGVAHGSHPAALT